MSLKGTTTHPEEVRAQFADFADVLDVYASDQIASLRWKGGKREKEIRAATYREIAQEMRDIVWEEGPPQDVEKGK